MRLDMVVVGSVLVDMAVGLVLDDIVAAAEGSVLVADSAAVH